MQPMQWNLKKLMQDNTNIEQALLSDEQTLVFFRQDFGKIIQSNPALVFSPKTTDELQQFIKYAADHHIPVTIRGMGLSQGGQSLAVDGGICLSMAHFNKTLELEHQTIWAEANARWVDILEKTLPYQLAPYVLPYNCNLPVAGVLSVGGVGAASFKESLISTHVEAIEVVDGQGERHTVDETSPLYEACLGGQGRCGVITRACIQLRPVSSHVITYYLVYNDKDQWLADAELAKQTADYLELFCSPSIQGAALVGERRVPIAEWLYSLQISYEFDENPPRLGAFKPWKHIHTQEETILSYLLRHEARLNAMKTLGQWELAHPWYECFTPAEVLKDNLEDILKTLPVHYANLVHVVPIAKRRVGMTMFPETESFYSLMILNPGVADPLKESCLEAIKCLDKRLLQRGGKRYLSGYLGTQLDQGYWQTHFGERYQDWVNLKKQYDPTGIFTSCLFQ